MLNVSVSNLDLYRFWRDESDLELEWLLMKLRGEEEPTENMKAGKAFHKILEQPDFDEQTELTMDGYWFSILCDISLELPPVRELSIDKQYDGLLVRGRIDGMRGLHVTDYKTTEQFDADRLMTGYQWRYYLDMLDCDVFTWKVFVLRQYGKPGHYDVTQEHTLVQKRYPNLRDDCLRLANDYRTFLDSIADRFKPKDREPSEVL